MAVRPATPADLPKIKALNVSCLQENYPTLFWKTQMQSGLHLVAYDPSLPRTSSSLLGYLATMPHRDNTIPHNSDTASPNGDITPGILIYSFAVRQSSRKKGIGTLLLSKLFEMANNNGCNLFFLQVRKTNYAAISLYSKFGFVATEDLPSYYQDGEDAIVMSTDLIAFKIKK